MGWQGWKRLSVVWLLCAMCVAPLARAATVPYDEIAASTSLALDFTLIRAALDGVRSPDEALQVLEGLYQAMLRKTTRQYDTKLATAEAEDAIRASWDTDLLIRRTERHWKEVNDPRLLLAARNLVRVLRSIREQIGEFLHDNKGFVAQPVALQGGFPQLLTNSEHFAGGELLQDGDVLLSKGDAYMSSLIAGISDIDSHYSHAAIVHKDAQGRFWTVEAHIEDGSHVFPIAEYAKGKKSRVLVLRHHDAARAARAAKWVFDKVKKGHGIDGPIKYDFAMKLNDANWYCSELVREAFKSQGSEGLPPEYLSTILNLSPCVLDQLGVEETVVFAPGDLELDRNFDVVAEWSNPAKTPVSRRRDAILSVFFAKLTEHKVVLKPALWQQMLATVIHTIRRVPGLEYLVNGFFPLNMKRKTLETFVTFHILMTRVEKILKIHDEKYFADHKVRMSFPELFALAMDLATRVKSGDPLCSAGIAEYFQPEPVRRIKVVKK